MKETLDYIRVARKAKDGNDGFLYLHHFGTGHQLLIFASHESANGARARFGTPEYEKFLKQPA